jgi:putative peptide zinc metalloprotease protein
MQGSGFVVQPWLVERDNRFIQLSELLYRVAEAVNGRRKLAQIATHLTKTTEWIVTPDLVRQIITTKLAPLGIVVMADSPDEAAVEKRPVSPLSIQMRAKLIGPSVIEPITLMLQILFAPPILIPLLTLIAIAHWWVYFEHGIGNSIRAALYTPGFLPLSLLMLIVANVFHEFGHAAALHYGGGRARSMGAGIYLIWPMLYTDVTESYRLGRWARLRTDLGGVYFHLIAALGVVVLYLSTGHEYLLMVVLLISVEVMAQFVPFARLDGYWMIADLTGIPDFFSQMKPFLRSIIPGRHWQGSKLPPVKRWAQVVFATYITITVPVLALLFLLMVSNLPKMVMTAWDALLYQRVEFTVARMNGDLLLMFAIVVQVLFLLLQFVGVGLILYSVARVPLTVVRSALAARRWWLAGTALGATTAAVMALAFVWMP